MKKNIFFIGVIILLFSCGKSSEEEFTSKINEVTALEAKAKKMSTANGDELDSTLFYITKIQKIIEKNEKLPDTFLIENLFRKGYYYKRINIKDSAAFYFHKTIDLIKRPNTRKRNRVYFRNTWLYDESNKRYANAINSAEKFIEISDETKDAGDLVFAYHFLNRIHLKLNDTSQAIRYNTKGIEAAMQSSNTSNFITLVNNKVDYLYDLEKKEQAFKLLDSLSDIKTESKEVLRQLSRSYGNLYYKEKDHKSAIKKYEIALKYSKDTNTRELESYNNIADSYIELKEYNTAKVYLDSAKTKITYNSPPEDVNYYHELYFKLNYRTKVNEKELLKNYENLIKENKERHQETIKEKLNALTIANAKEKNAIEEKNEEKIKNIKLIVLSALLGLFTIIAYLFQRQRRFKFEKQELQMQQRLLRSQMNPHFTFNTLSAIQNQIKENQEGAINYLLKFSRLLRMILENSLHNYVQIEKELESLRRYIDLQLLCFPKKFDYKIILENFEEEDLLFIPPMLIQPFVENSIEHGFLGINYTGSIMITLKLQDKFIACSIEDNGVGIIESNNTYKKSVSTKLISKFINKATKSNVTIVNKKNEERTNSGVLIKFLVPYKFSEND